MKTKTVSRKMHTGRNLVLLSSGLKRERLFKAAGNASIRMAHFNDFLSDPGSLIRVFDQSDGIYFETLNVAVVNFNKEDEIDFMNRHLASKAVLFTEPERYVYKIERESSQVKERTLKRKQGVELESSSWGIKATGADKSAWTGEGINVAILDTGIFRKHVDLKNRKITSKKFVETGTSGDVDGHGSHCAGIACGFKDPYGFRYGVAYKSAIFAAKVLNDLGEGTDSGILAGIEWALSNKCRVISMSLGAAAEPGEPYSETYENVARRAIKNGALIVSAAGNESSRPSYVAPVGHPANCPSILAVGAIDSALEIADFSCGGTEARGGQVDLVAPGVSVYSMINTPDGHEKWDGTSMATPFVSGIAALFFQQFKTAKPLDVWAMLTQNARRLDVSSADGGSGLVQAP